jgi:hypothetical protein
VTSTEDPPSYAPLRAALAALSNQVWQQAGDAQLPKAVAQYIWTNMPGKIAETSKVLDCITPDNNQANAIREVSQYGKRDILPILEYVEESEEFSDEVRQEAHTAWQRITAHLERESRKQAVAVDTLAPFLDNFAGYVCAGIRQAAPPTVATTTSGTPSGPVHHAIQVWLEPVQPADAFYEPVLIRNGKDTDEVLFDIFLDSENATIERPRYVLACRPGTSSGRLQFSTYADAGSDRIVYWVNVFQKNRLIQILEFNAGNIETENWNGSERSKSRH